MNILLIIGALVAFWTPSVGHAEEWITSYIAPEEEIDALTPGFHMFVVDLRSQYEVTCIKKGELVILHEANTDYLMVQWSPEYAPNIDDPSQTQGELDQLMVQHLNFMPYWTIVGRIQCDDIAQEMLAEWGLLDPASELIRLRYTGGFGYWLAVLVEAEIPDRVSELLASGTAESSEESKL